MGKGDGEFLVFGSSSSSSSSPSRCFFSLCALQAVYSVLEVLTRCFCFHLAFLQPFEQITELTDVPEGTIVRVITRLDQTCQEVRDAARVIGDAGLFQKMEDAQTKIKRDIVFAASLCEFVLSNLVRLGVEVCLLTPPFVSCLFSIRLLTRPLLRDGDEKRGLVIDWVIFCVLLLYPQFRCSAFQAHPFMTTSQTSRTPPSDLRRLSPQPCSARSEGRRPWMSR